ncbi:DNA-binding protein Ewg-like isoform X2 [Drosophila obscura]|uniref:DNA-binding protein Ewg-like isoform X2 n=1 Tax=Drosophila obscura TaxID=7282 RepID=UPI001BB218EC|nr:DNA-binding protein Ewg-like isoform X2 [Drosophila obscura]
MRRGETNFKWGVPQIASKDNSNKMLNEDEDMQTGSSDDNEEDRISSDVKLDWKPFNAGVAHQLAAAGPVGVAAAAAIASSSRRRNRAHYFEVNPAVRKRTQNQLLRKLRAVIDEFSVRVGKQAVVLVAQPGKPNGIYEVFGANPLKDVLLSLNNIVLNELDHALDQQAPPPPQHDPSLFTLPGLVINGMPTPVEMMTLAQLRTFIPLMLKYSTGRRLPGWGRQSTRPPWWPREVAWANVRLDARSVEEKQSGISYSNVLRKIVISCYKYHGREDLLPSFDDLDDVLKLNDSIAQASNEDMELSGRKDLLPTVAADNDKLISLMPQSGEQDEDMEQSSNPAHHSPFTTMKPSTVKGTATCY